MPEKFCTEHHKVMYRSAMFQVIIICIMIGGVILGLSFCSFASSDSHKALQRQVDRQSREWSKRFDRIDDKLDAMTK